METTAQPSSDGWVLNGQKLWIGNAPVADVAIVWAKAIETPSSQATSASIRGFVVPTSSQGFESQQMTGKLSLRAAITGSVSLTDCVVNHDALHEALRGGAGMPVNGLLPNPFRLKRSRFG